MRKLRNKLRKQACFYALPRARRIEPKETVPSLERGIESIGERDNAFPDLTGSDGRGFYFKVYDNKYRIASKELHNFRLTDTRVYNSEKDVLIHSDSFRPYIADPLEKFVVVRIKHMPVPNVGGTITLEYAPAGLKRNYLIIDYPITRSTGPFAEEISPAQNGYTIMRYVLDFLRIRNSKYQLDEKYETLGDQTLDCFHQFLEQSYEIWTKKREGGFSFKMAGTEYDCRRENMLGTTVDRGDSFSPETDVQICPSDYVHDDAKQQGKIVWIRTRVSVIEAPESETVPLPSDGKTIGIAVWINPKREIRRSGRNFEDAFTHVLKFLAGIDPGQGLTVCRPGSRTLGLK